VKVFSRVSIICLIIISTFTGCRKDPSFIQLTVNTLDSVFTNGQFEPYQPSLPVGYYDYETVFFTDYFLNDPQLNMANNSNDGFNVTNEGATLGRVLFYDKNLSINNTISCASCHHQNKAFADSVQYSMGFNGGLTSRNSMAIFNMNYNRRFFWDTRSNTIENQVLQPIQHPVEMGMTLENLVAKISQLNYYDTLFEEAFGTSDVTTDRIATALGMFIKSMRSYQSKYDKGLTNNFTEFTSEELYGKDLFYSGQMKCNHCHSSHNVGGLDRLNNGLETFYTDQGVALVTNNEADIGKFKSVSLRNIGLTAPYMHDGRFNTLEEVMDHYIEHGHSRPFAAFELSTSTDLRTLTAQEKADIIAFLHALTDTSYFSRQEWQNPFVVEANPWQ